MDFSGFPRPLPLSDGPGTRCRRNAASSPDAALRVLRAPAWRQPLREGTLAALLSPRPGRSAAAKGTASPRPGGALPQKLPEPWLGVAVLRRRPPLRTWVSSVLTASPRGPWGTNAASALDPTPTARSHTGSRGRHLHGSRVRAFPVWKAFPISDAQLRSESLGRSRGGQAGAQGRSQGPLSTFQSQLPFLKSAPPRQAPKSIYLDGSLRQLSC